MQISIRGVLGLILIVALSVYAVQVRNEASAAKEAWKKRLHELTEKQEKLGVHRPKVHDAIQHTVQRSKSVSERSATSIIKRLTHLDPVSGHLVMRPVPSNNSGTKTLIFNLPESREVSLRFGVMQDLRMISFKEPTDEEMAKIKTKTAFANTGPFELKLKPGTHQIKFIQRSDPDKKEQELFQIQLIDPNGVEQKLLEIGPIPPTGQHMSVFGDRRKEYPIVAKLPLLYGFFDADSSHFYATWFSCKPLSTPFASFPMEGDSNRE